MRHFPGGGCLKGEQHAGTCEWNSSSGDAGLGVGSVDLHDEGALRSGEGGDQTTRQARWKARNREKMRAHHREYMREWRKRILS